MLPVASSQSPNKRLTMPICFLCAVKLELESRGYRCVTRGKAVSRSVVPKALQEKAPTRRRVLSEPGGS